MMRDWRAQLVVSAASTPVVMITVIATEGSAPRDVGARVLVDAQGINGSIGGGQLEFQAIARACDLLAHDGLGPWYRETQRVILGPDTNQCCGGVVELLFEVVTPREALVFAGFADDILLRRSTEAGSPPQTKPATPRAAFHVDRSSATATVIEPVLPLLTPLYIYGAGHVARALVQVLQGLHFALTWIDQARDRFPAVIAPNIDVVVTATPADRASRAPAYSVHLIMTHSHDLDYGICRVLLAREDLRFVGLIGSATKRARFAQRYKREGLAASSVERLICPIGHADIKGKAPEIIAVSVAAQLLSVQDSRSAPP